MRRSHLVQRRYSIHEPNIVPDVAVEIGEVWVHRVVVKVDVSVGFGRLQPGFLHGDGVIILRRRARLLILLHRPVVTVVSDGANDLLFGNHLQRVLQVLDEPILAGDGTGIATGIVLVIIHQDDAVGDFGNGGVVEVLVVDRDSDVKLQSFGLKIAIELR